MPVSDIKRLYWYVSTLKLSGIVEWGCQPPARQRQLFHKWRALLHHGVSMQQDAGSELPPIQLNLSPRVNCVWHAIHFHFSASNSSSSLLLLSFRFRVLCSKKPNSCKRHTQLDAESFGNKYPANRYIVMLIYTGINQFEKHGAVYSSEVSPWPRIMRLNRLYFWPFF